MQRRSLLQGAAAALTLRITVNPQLILGAQINGALQPPATLAALVTATPAGGTLLLPAGVWSGTSGVTKACTIAGAGIGQTILDASGINTGMGVLAPNATGVVIQDMTIRNASNADDNGAGIRDNASGEGYTAIRVEFSGNEMGVMSYASPIVLTDCVFHDNGAGDARSHEMYFNVSGGGSATLTNVNSTCGTRSTHAVKSRLATTAISGGTYTQNPDSSPNSVGGSVIDIPDGGAVSIDGATLIVTESGADANNYFIGYAMESIKNLAFGSTMTLTNVHLIDGSRTGGIIRAGNPAAGAAHLIIGDGCRYDGAVAPVLMGWASVTGAFVPA